ncbi:MAG: IS66 family insertion sequence element accessory protein TnpB [Methylobacter sp.]|nr:IS66 family insertion sequence element accessory protein TnpB [Methylobacter sp.]
MRRGIDGLSSIVQQALGHSPCTGSAFVFHNRSSNRLKVLLWDGNGVWLCRRRLHQGKVATLNRTVDIDNQRIKHYGEFCDGRSLHEPF